MKIGDYFLMVYDDVHRTQDHMGVNEATFKIVGQSPNDSEYRLIGGVMEELVCTGTKFDTYRAALKGGAKLGLFRIASLDGIKSNVINTQYEYNYDGAKGYAKGSVEYVVFPPLSPSVELVYNVTDNWSDPFNRMCDCSVCHLSLFFDYCIKYGIVRVTRLTPDELPEPRKRTLWDKIRALFR